MLDVLLEAATYTGAHAVPIIGSVMATIAGSKLLASRDTSAQVADHDRRARELNEDLRRWVQDRQRQVDVRMREVAEQARVRNVMSVGVLRASAGKVYWHVLHEYRDAATIKQRALDELLGAEGRSHRRYRRRRDLPTPTLALPEDCRVLVDGWRDRAEEDVTRPELEPRLHELEAAA